MKYWKMRKMLNNYSEYNYVVEVIREHYEMIKEIFVSATVDSNQPPDFRRDSFYKFCEKANIPTYRLNRGVIDTFFKATNFELVD